MDEPAEGTTHDSLLNGRVFLLQPVAGYRVAIDPVILAASVPAQGGERALDVGCGVGAATLCLATRVPGLKVTGIELERSLAQLATENAALNKLDDRVDVLLGDLERPPPRLAPRSFDHVLANPPFQVEGAHRPSPNPMKARANSAGLSELDDWLEFCCRMTRPGGSVTMIHRPERLSQILAALERAGAGGAVVYPLWSHNPFEEGPAARGAIRVVVQAVADSRGPMQLSGGLVLHDADGSYSHAADRVLRRGLGLPLRDALE